MTAKRKPLLRRLRRDERGAYAVEFGLILTAFLTLILGIMDMAVQMYAKAVLSGAVEMAARANTLEGNAGDQTQIDQMVRDRVNTVAPYGTLNFSRLNYQDFSAVGQPEEFTDGNNNGMRDPGECYEDANGNGQWDADRARTGQGGANDVVLYRVTMEFQRLFPLWRFLGISQDAQITVSTVLRNQPYANQTNPMVVRCG